MAKTKVLVLDQDPIWSLALSDELIKVGCEVLTASQPADALILLQAHNAGILLTDDHLASHDVFPFLEQVQQLYPSVALVICSSKASVANAVAATKRGVTNYLEKSATPSGFHQISLMVKEIAQQQSLLLDTRAATDSSDQGSLRVPAEGFYGIVSQNIQMRDIFEMIQTIADSSANVLICGETGTGKELVAHAIHSASNRHGKPFVTMDCSVLAPQLLESELFGHEKGAFTGAAGRHIGRFERANGGTLFLDEVANIDLTVQAKLLRVLQTRTFERVGGLQSITVDVRIVAATNRPLDDLTTEGSFREDLYHRLNVVEVLVPPLRDRLEDVSLLAAEFLCRFARQHRKDVRGFTSEAMSVLTGYRWPGNVRELENVVLQAVVLAKSPYIDSAGLPQRISQPAASMVIATGLSDQLRQPEKEILMNTLQRHGGNIKRAAAELDVSRTTLYAKLKRYGVDPTTLRQ